MLQDVVYKRKNDTFAERCNAQSTELQLDFGGDETGPRKRCGAAIMHVQQP